MTKCRKVFQSLKIIYFTMDNQNTEMLATFSETGGEKECGLRERCHGSRHYPVATKFKFFGNRDSTKPGRNLCPSCTEHVLSKDTTIRKSDTGTGVSHIQGNPIMVENRRGALVDEQAIYRMNVDGQRGRKCL